MAGFEAFDREIRLATAGFEPEAINAMLATFARQELAKVQAQGASKAYDLFVNGRPAQSENEVQAPGPIVYEFALWEPVITFALERLRTRSPVKSGRFRNSFIVVVNQTVVTNFDSVWPGAEVIITNFQPYIRKAEGGQLGVKRFAIFDGAKRDLARQFGNDRRNAPGIYRFDTRWLNMSSGVHPNIPYILKGGEKARAVAQNARSSAFRAGRLTLSRRKDREAGQPITYPAVVMNMVL
jgi:hypothetical protein